MKLGANILDQRQRAAAIGLSAAIGAIVLIALLLSLRLTTVAAPSATTWHVHPNGSDSDPGTLGLPFKTIQHAIDRAEDGDTILVAAGAYTENVIITKTLTLRGGRTSTGHLVARCTSPANTQRWHSQAARALGCPPNRGRVTSIVESSTS